MTDTNLFTGNPLGTTIHAADIKDTFDFLDSWEDRYAYVIELGKQLPPFPAEAKTESHLVHGCQSQVWLLPCLNPDDGKLYFLIDSDALIVRGLAAVVLVALNARAPAEIANVDVDELFRDLDLFRHISPTRGNGLRSMVARIRDIARQVSG